jgi:transcriptional adapter 2-alpha
MTVIQKKRKYAEDVAGEYGQKYHCDHCQKDITGVVRIRCSECPDFDLCVECFSTGVEVRDHKNDHAYRVMDILDFPLFDENWGADEELALIESLENYGLGNWEQAAEHVGTKDKNECRMHYLQTYIYSDTFPLPVRNVGETDG